jgi:uncharacterized protein (DUF1015 family)
VRIKAFQALRPPAKIAHLVASVPYDTVNTEEAVELARGNPRSLLHVSRSEIDLPTGTDPHSSPVYVRALENFTEFQKKRFLVREGKPHLYVYRQIMGNHTQRGVVACCHIEDYEKNVILKHEKTRREKEDDRTVHIGTLRANTGPVFLTYRDDVVIDALVASTEKRPPLYDFTSVDGIKHTVWRITDDAEMVGLFNRIPVCYIADGHHRAAASVRVGNENRIANPSHTGGEEYNWFLAVLFPAKQLQILSYNRCVSDLNGLTQVAFLDAVKKRFSVVRGAKQSPSEQRQVSMYLGGEWYGMSWDPIDAKDIVSNFDVSVLQSQLLDPILGIKEPRTDRRIEFIGGIRGTGELVKLVDSGKAAVAFSMHPVTVEDVMAIADAGLTMPPKSTWFEPKLRSGLLIHTF